MPGTFSVRQLQTYKTVALLGVATAISSCSDSQFRGVSPQNAQTNSPPAASEATPTTPTSSSSPSPSVEPPAIVGILNPNEEIVPPDDDKAIKNGIIVEECKQSIELPSAPTALTENFNWHASGSTASFNQVMATVVAGLLDPADTASTLVAPAFDGNTCNYTSGGAYLYAIDGKTGAQKWVSSIQVLALSSAAIGDIDGDGMSEVVAIGMDRKVHAFSKTGAIKWSSAETVAILDLFWNTGPTLADLSNDGKVSVIVADKVFDGKDGTLRFALSGVQVTEQNPIVANTDGMAGFEIVAANGIYKANGSLLCSYGSKIEMFASARIRSQETFETVVGREESGKLMAFNGKTCAKIFDVTFPGVTRAGADYVGVIGGGPFNFADLNGAGDLKFSSGGYSDFMTFDGSGSLFWKKATKDASSGATGSTTFDFNGDGKNEIVYNDEDYLRIYDGSTGSVLYQTPNSSGTAWEYPVIADTDGDGHANLVVHANSCFANTNQVSYGVRVFQAPTNNWVGTRPIWNQHAYNPLLVKANGSLVGIDPETIWKPWLASSHLVGFRNNVPKALIKTSCLN